MTSNRPPAASVDTAMKTNEQQPPREFDGEQDIVHATRAEMLANLAAVKAAILKEPEVLKFVPLGVQMQMLDVVRVIINNYPEKYFPVAQGYTGEEVQLACLDWVRRAVEEQDRWLEFISPRVQAQMFTNASEAGQAQALFEKLDKMQRSTRDHGKKLNHP